MSTEVKAKDGKVIGYYFWDNLSHCWIGVRADGQRASGRHAFQVVRFIEGDPEE